MNPLSSRPGQIFDLVPAPRPIRGPLRGWKAPFPFACLALVSLLCIRSLAKDALSLQPGPVEPLASVSQPVEITPYSVTELGSNHRVWSRVTAITNQLGKVRYHTNSYTELATGLNHLVEGKWVESSDEIEITAAGAQATNGQHQVAFSGELNTAGAIDLTTPDGKHLRSHILGLSYFDTATGANVLIAELKDSHGQLLPTKNQVLYPDAFTDFRADVRYTYTKAGFEQDIILREQPPSPARWGMNPQTTKLQVLTEFFDAPDAKIMPENGKYGPADGVIDFGGMRIGHGKAFLSGANPTEIGGVAVQKHWQMLDGRRFLIEEVPLKMISTQLQTLPIPSTSGNGVPTGPILNKVLPQRRLPPLKLAKHSEPMSLASATDRETGFVLDYTAISSDQTNYTFQSDTTYYISGQFTVYGVTTIEGGTVVKYTNNATELDIYAVNCLTSPYRPAIFTSKDDNTAGEAIVGSTGVPSGHAASTAIQFITDPGGSGPTTNYLSYLRLSYASCGLGFGYLAEWPSYEFIKDVQILHSDIAVGMDSTAGTHYLTFKNGLIVDAGTGFECDGNGGVIEHLTIDKCARFAANSPCTADGLYVTNSILADVTNIENASCVGVTGDHNVFYNTTHFGTAQYSASSWPFQTVGAASYYLADNSPYRNAGTASIDPALLAELSHKTTYPPIVMAAAGVITNVPNMNLFPQAQRDTDTPDLGYHYDPLDYVFGGIAYSNTVITVNPGVAIGVFSPKNAYGQANGWIFYAGGQLLCQGSPANRNWIVRYNTVQEQSTTNWTGGFGFLGGNLDMISEDSPPPVVQCRFTDFSVLAQDADAFNNNYIVGTPVPPVFQDCQFHGGTINSDYNAVILTNCLFERVNANYTMTDTNVPVMRNNLFWRGTFNFDEQTVTNALVKDNFFDQTVIYDNSYDYGTYNGGHNAYVTTNNMLQPTNATDLILTNLPNYQSSWLGNYYLPTNSPLINADTNTTADQVGLYHYTTTTNQVKETNSFLDIGYHYVAVDAYGNPIDTNGDGVPDYLEDANGNGVADPGERDWLDPDVDYDGRNNLQEIADGTDPLNPNSVLHVQLGFWRFNDISWVGEQGQVPLAYTNIQNVNAWLTGALLVNSNNPAYLKYRDVETNGNANINCRNGSVRFWFQPQWTSGSTTLSNRASLIEMGSFSSPATSGWWSLYLNTNGTQVTFASQTNGATTANFTANINWTSGTWYQIVLNYTPTNSALYVNNVLVTNGSGILYYPNRFERTNGFTIGADKTGSYQTRGVFEDLDTFNYPLDSQSISNNFETNRPPTTLSGLLLWLSADAANISTNISGITTWQDQSGNGFNATHNVSYNQPQWISSVSGLNNRPVVRFTASSGQLLNLPNGMFGSITQAEAFVILKAANATPSANRPLWWIGGNGYGINGFPAYPDPAGNIDDDFGSSEGGPPYNMFKPAQPLDQYHLYGVATSPSRWTARINGVVHYAASPNTVYFRSSGITLGGANLSAYNDYFDGDIAEVIMFSRVLSNVERDSIGSYLNNKYSLVTSPALPTNLVASTVSASQINLTWNDAMGLFKTSFKIERRTTGGSFAQIALVENGLSYLDTGLSAGTQYYYRIKANNYGGDSSYSNTNNATTLTVGTDIPVTNLVMWLKADTGVENGPTPIWLDQSGHTNDAGPNITLTPPVTPPTTVGTVSGLNNRSVVRFNAANSEHFILPDHMFDSLTQVECCVVLKATNAVPGTSRSLWWLGTSIQGANGVPAYPNTAGHILEDFGTDPINGEFPYDLGAPVSLTSYNVYGIVSQPAEWTARINGDIVYTVGTNTVKFKSTHLHLGAAENGGALVQYFDGDIAEVMIFNRVLTVPERNSLGAYLNNSYSVITNIPTSPSNLTAQALSPTSLNLFWQGTSTNDASVVVERAAGSPTASYSVVGTVSGGATNCVDNAVADGTTLYYYRAKATSYAGPSGYCNTDAPPTVLITNLYNGIPLTAGSNFTVSASPSANSGTITKVDFYNFTNNFGTVTTSPFTLTISNLSQFYETITAKATDSQSNSRLSTPIFISVYPNTSGDGRNDAFDVILGLDPSTNTVPLNPADTTPPVINLTTPTNATPVP